jgi:L-asparagine permease
VLLTGFIYLIGVFLNLKLPHDAFEITIEFSAVGIIGMWCMIMIAHLAFYRATQAGLLPRPEFRMPWAPYSNYVTVAFLIFVLAMTWFNGKTGQFIIYSLPVIVLLLVAGWFACRKGVERIRQEGGAHHHSHSPLE